MQFGMYWLRLSIDRLIFCFFDCSFWLFYLRRSSSMSIKFDWLIDWSIDWLQAWCHSGSSHSAARFSGRWKFAFPSPAFSRPSSRWLDPSPSAWSFVVIVLTGLTSPVASSVPSPSSWCSLSSPLASTPTSTCSTSWRGAQCSPVWSFPGAVTFSAPLSRSFRNVQRNRYSNAR